MNSKTQSTLQDIREPYLGRSPGKYFKGDDLPAKPKKIVHLVTYPNFLSSNFDHSQDRPFTNSSPYKTKKSFMPNEFHRSSGNPPPFNDFKADSKKISIREGHQVLSTINPISFDPEDRGPAVKAEIRRSPTRNKSNLTTSAQPLNEEPIRSSKRVGSGRYTDSSSMKLSLSYAS